MGGRPECKNRWCSRELLESDDVSVKFDANVNLFRRQRRFPRYACGYGIVIVDHSGHKANGECRTLSQGGFGATISGDLPVGSIVSVVFKPALLHDTVSLEARVLYHEKELHGFEFVAPVEKREIIAALFREAVGEGESAHTVST